MCWLNTLLLQRTKQIKSDPSNKMKDKKYHTVGIVPKSNSKYHTVRTVPKSNRKYHTVGTVPKSNTKIPHCRNSSKIQYENTTLSEQFQNLTEKYHTVGTVPKSNTKIPHCRNSSKI